MFLVAALPLSAKRVVKRSNGEQWEGRKDMEGGVFFQAKLVEVDCWSVASQPHVHVCVPNV